MASSPVFFQNSPVSGTQYWAPMWCGCIPNNASSISVKVQAWSGANGTGSLVAVTSLEAIRWDQTANVSKGSFTASSANTATSTGTNGTNGVDWFKASVIYTGGAIGSLGLQVSVFTGTAWVPAVPTFSPAFGAVGNSVTLTGSRFTDATFVQFNGTGASFSVSSDTSIAATVPSGATTGAITVGNPGGSSASASNFLVGTAYVRRSGLWVPFTPQARRTGVWTPGTPFVRRSGVWTQGG